MPRQAAAVDGEWMIAPMCTPTSQYKQLKVSLKKCAVKSFVLHWKKVVGTTYVANLKGIRLVKVAEEQVWANEKSLLEKRLKDLKEGKEAVYFWEEVKAVAFSKP